MFCDLRLAVLYLFNKGKNGTTEFEDNDNDTSSNSNKNSDNDDVIHKMNGIDSNNRKDGISKKKQSKSNTWKHVRCESMQRTFKMNDVMCISFLNYHDRKMDEHKEYDDTIGKCGANRLELNISESNLLLQTLSLKRIIELTTHSAIFIFKDDNFSVCITVEFEKGIVLRVAPHLLSYCMVVYYSSMGSFKTQQKEFALQVGKGIPTITTDINNTNGHKNNNNNSNNINSMNDNTNTRKSHALQPSNSESISQRCLSLRTSSLSWHKIHLQIYLMKH